MLIKECSYTKKQKNIAATIPLFAPLLVFEHVNHGQSETHLPHLPRVLFQSCCITQ